MSDGKVIIKIDGDSKSFEKELQTVTKIATTSLAAVGAAATAAAAAIYKVGTEFETSMAKVSTIADTSRASLEQLSNGIIKLSNETGIAATELSNAMYEAISASVDTADAVSFTEQAVKLAKGGFTDAASAVDVMTTVLNSYGLAATEATRVSDVLIQVQNEGKTTVNELASNMGRVIPTASAYGVSLENLGAAYARMTSNGVATAETTTYINSMLNELGKSGTTASSALVKLSGKTFKQLMDSGSSLGEVLSMLEEHAEVSGLSIADMFGSAEAGKAALTLLSAGVDGFNESLEGMQSCTGLTETAFNTMAGTAETSAEIIKNKFANLGIDIYNQNSESIDAMMTAVGSLADEAISFAQNAAPVLADAVTWMIDNAGLLAAALQSAVTALILFKTTSLATTAISAATKAITDAKKAVDEYTKACAANQNVSVLLASTMTPLQFTIGVLTGEITRATAAQVALNVAKKAFLGLIPLIVAGIGAAVTAFVNYVKNADTSATRTQKLKEELATLRDEYEQATEAAEDNADAERAKLTTTDKLISRLAELDSIMKSGTTSTDEYTAASNELKTVVDELNKIMPDLKIGIDDETRALTDQISEVKKLYDAYKDLYILKIQASVYEEKLTAAGKALVAAEDKFYALPNAEAYERDMEYLDPRSENYNPLAINTLNDPRKKYDNSSELGAAYGGVAVAQSEYDKVFDEYVDVQSELSDAMTSLNTANDNEESESGDKVDGDEETNTYETEYKALDRAHKLGEISEAEYYKSLGALRDKYLDESSDDWLDVTVEINDYNERVADEAEKAAEDAANAAKKAAEEAERATQEEIEAKFKTLDRSYKLGEISEEEYYTELGELRDTYLDESSDEWLDATLKINDYNERAAEEAAEAAEKAIDDRFKALERRYKLGEITEEEYYQKLGELRDEYLDETSDEWLDITLEIKDYNDRAAAEIEETAKAVAESIEQVGNSVKTTFENAISDLQDKQQSFANSLLSAGAPVEKKTKTYTLGRFSHTMEYTELADLDKQTQDMQEYADALEAVKNRGALPEGFFAELRGMSMEEGLDFANALLRASDEEFTAYLEAWKERQKVADEISKEVYTDEAGALIAALEEEFGQVPEDFFDLGEDSAEKYGEGFMEKLPGLMETIKSEITAGLAAILPGFTSTDAPGNGTTYNVTYNLLPGDGESTQAQLVVIRNAEKLNEQGGA